MIYKTYQELEISALGMGAMRLPVKDGNDSVIDRPAAEEMVRLAMEQGINYYDTAWGYHGGNSEEVMGQALRAYPRDSYYLADKFPGYDLSNMDKVEEIFEKQLKKCGVDYFDFYLFHNVCEMNIDAYLDEKYGIYQYLMKQRKQGRIRHLGFSAHGSYDVLKRFLEAYGKDMEFCQIQLNYLDWTFQDAKAKVELLREYQIPIWVMEPLRGGQLIRLSKEDTAELQALRPEESLAGWAFRFLQSIPDIVVTLTGASSPEELKENIDIFQEEKPLNEEELAALQKIADKMIHQASVPCTACHYCVSHCPQKLDIPGLLGLYNEHCLTGGGFITPMALMAVPPEKQPSACIGCGSCEAVCPQQIKIADAMKDFTEKLNG